MSKAPTKNAPAAFEYTGPDRRIYTDIPATVDPGDVMALPGPPDQWWRPTDKPATRRPDNAIQE